MKEKIRKNKIIISVIILILFGVGIGAWWYQYQNAMNFCKEKCIYIPYETRDYFRSPPEYVRADYWRFGGLHKV